jgi:hypothetical protein
VFESASRLALRLVDGADQRRRADGDRGCARRAWEERLVAAARARCALPPPPPVAHAPERSRFLVNKIKPVRSHRYYKAQPQGAATLPRGGQGAGVEAKIAQLGGTKGRLFGKR